MINQKALEKSIKLNSDGSHLHVTLCIFIALSSLLLITLWILTQISYALYFGNDLSIINHKQPSSLLLPKQIAATEKGDVFIVWVDKNSIYFTSSHYNQTKFGAKVHLSDGNKVTSLPQIAATEKGDVYVVWVDKNSTSGDSNIVFVNSNDSGKTFSLRKEIMDNDLLSFSPQIAATEKGDVYVVWVDKNSTSGDIDIAFRNSNDSGMDFNKIINLNMGDNKYYRYSLNFSAKDVNQLHSKVYYYDSNKTEIKDDFIFGGKDGTFYDTISNTLPIPSTASFIKLQTWVHQNPINDSSYILYDTKILPTTGKKITWTNDNKDTQTISVGANEATSGNNSLKVDLKQGNATDWNVITTDFIPVAAVNLSTSFSPQIAATEKGDVYVVWVARQVQFKEILDRGTVLGETISVSNETVLPVSPQIAATEKGDLYMIWLAKKNIIDDEVLLFKRISKFYFDRDI